ncbi:MAG: hypothetical protein AB7T10_06450 [bacterium]
MNKGILLLLLFLPSFVNGYVAQEYIDSEYILDEFCSSYIRDEFHDYLAGDNRVIISGGCYNVQQLSMKSMLKLSVPINSVMDFKLNNLYYDDLEFNEKVFNFGLSFRISDFAHLGFLANPTFYKKESDISILAGISGFNTKNQVIFTFDNFDNNYSHKDWNEHLPEPRIYTKQPYTLTVESSGYLKELAFYTIFVRRFDSSEDHFQIVENTDSFIYDYTADSALMYLSTGYRYGKKMPSVHLEGGFAFTSLIMENAMSDSLSSIFENEKRFKLSGYFTAKKNPLTAEVFGEFSSREIDSLYEKKDWLLGAGILFNWRFIDISFKQVFSNLNSLILPDSLLKDSPQSRLVLTVTYKINENTGFTARKGFETDKRDIEAGGKYFFYDKGYILFYMNFDNFLTRGRHG